MRELARTVLSLGLPILCAASLAAAAPEGEPEAAPPTCDVLTKVELESKEPSEGAVKLVFDVRLDAGCECASVTYDLVLEEKLPNKQWKAVRETRRVDVRGAAAEERVEHRMAADIELIGYSAKAVETTPCS
jgi:hypothetical protein